MASRFSAVPRSHFLYVHDCVKKIWPSAKVNAYISDKHPFRCDMCSLSTSYRGATDASALGHFTRQMQEIATLANVTQSDNHLEFCFKDSTALTMTLGVPGITIDVINSTQSMSDRTFLRNCLGYDEEIFIRSTDRDDRLAAAVLDDFAFQYTVAKPQFRPPLLYWFSHIYRVRETFGLPPHDPVIVLTGTVKEYGPQMFGEVPLEAPFCEGEDLNTTLVAKQYNLFVMDHLSRAKALNRDPPLAKVWHDMRPDIAIRQ